LKKSVLKRIRRVAWVSWGICVAVFAGITVWIQFLFSEVDKLQTAASAIRPITIQNYMEALNLLHQASLILDKVDNLLGWQVASTIGITLATVTIWATKIKVK